MKITFALPELNFSGGIKVVFDYAGYLMNQGHLVEVIYPPEKQKSFIDRVKGLVRRLLFSNGNDKGVPHGVGSGVPITRGSTPGKLTCEDFPDADLVIATWWETGEWIAPLPAAKGTKVHFVQGHEVFPYLPLDRVRAIYRKPWAKITVSGWLSDVCAQNYPGGPVYEVANGVDLERFSGCLRNSDQMPVVGMVWSNAKVKNSAAGAEALVKLKSSLPELQVTMFGSSPLPAHLARKDWIDFYYRPAQDLIPSLYAGCRLWLFPSLSEGFGLPILEAMAMHTPVVATHAGAAPDLVDGKNGILCDYTPESMAETMQALLAEPAAEWEQRSAAARRTAEANGFDSAAAKFESALKQILARADAER